jgi:hypothetical protein
MKYQWEPKDITVGRFYVKAAALEPNTGIGYVTSTMFMIGFANGGGPDNLVSIAVSDGMVGKPANAEQICDTLNNGEYAPADHDLVVRVFEARRRRNEGRE